MAGLHFPCCQNVPDVGLVNVTIRLYSCVFGF
uniref:Uncharacterized protein n=1 Tax=Arundo donax TaxID=35708 RepID=A0A0A9F939_ARUDO